MAANGKSAGGDVPVRWSKQQQDEAAQQLTDRTQAHDEAVGKHGDALIGVGDRSAENKRLLLERLTAAEQEMLTARREFSLAYGRQQQYLREERDLAEVPLQTGDVSLVSKGYLRPPIPTGSRESADDD